MLGHPPTHRRHKFQNHQGFPWWLHYRLGIGIASYLSLLWERPLSALCGHPILGIIPPPRNIEVTPLAIEPDQDCNALIDWLMQFAERQLANYGEFFPFGGAMGMDGTLSFVATHDGDEHPDSSNVIESLKKAFIGGGAKG